MSVHIEAKPGEIADKILLPGDPLRAKYIAEEGVAAACAITNSRTLTFSEIEPHVPTRINFFTL